MNKFLKHKTEKRRKWVIREDGWSDGTDWEDIKQLENINKPKKIKNILSIMKDKIDCIKYVLNMNFLLKTKIIKIYNIVFKNNE